MVYSRPGLADAILIVAQRMAPKKTVADVQEQLGAANRATWKQRLAPLGLEYPPSSVILVCLKEEKRLELYVSPKGKAPVHVESFPILAASGGPGPKLREGDRQVPEGIYGIESLNPNSRFHLSLRINYPNAFDRHMAAAEGRTNLGGDVMIHGSNVSIGCLAMGDPVAERLFVLAADTGIRSFRVLMCPHDFRVKPAGTPKKSDPVWLAEVYSDLVAELQKLPSPKTATGVR
ncbi:MAG TPA: hypothetical protein DCY13_13890 [Verrucomicrobiales bacterium]|nr:hypothetical protein [Verrucomicrobiales bacterium]